MPYLFLAGCFLVWTQAENKSYKFLGKLAIGSIIFSFLSVFLIFLRMYVMSRWVYDAPLPFSELWDEERFAMAAVFSLSSFLGGMVGIVLKGFYELYRNKLDVVIIFVGPLLALLASLSILKIKFGGTIMSGFYGWPYSFLIHQIKDVVDGFSIDTWIFSPGSLYHYVIFDYFLYLIIFISVYCLIRFINKNLKIIKINSTIFLFGVLAVMILALVSFLSVKESYISYLIFRAGNCETDNDCVVVANRAPFSCAIVANKNNLEKILNLVNSFPSTGKLECSGREKAVCLENKCRVAIEQDPEDVNNFIWQRIKQAVENCEVGGIMQTHSLQITATLKDGTVIKAKEPEIDNIFEIVDKFKDKCGEIIMATE